ncbi:MAG: tRNA1(Val) (adenine(37)-N6)-methyltransferase [Maricaulaceae bacterium]
MSKPLTDIATFFDGRLTVRQPLDGYRAGLDAVLLASAAAGFTPARGIELGSGVGVALLGAALQTANSAWIGLERNAETLELSRVNIADNGLDHRVETRGGDVAAPPNLGKADLVMLNPPYYATPGAVRGRGEIKREAFVEGDADLGVWLKTARRFAGPKGWIVIIHRAERLADILAALSAGAGQTRVLPIAPRAGEPASRVLVAARMGSKAPLSLLPPLVLHDAAGDYRTEVVEILSGRRLLSLHAEPGTSAI